MSKRRRLISHEMQQELQDELFPGEAPSLELVLETSPGMQQELPGMDARPLAGAGVSTDIGELSVERDNLLTVISNLEDELNKLPDSLAIDEETDTEERLVRVNSQCIQRGSDKEWWRRRFENASKRCVLNDLFFLLTLNGRGGGGGLEKFS